MFSLDIHSKGREETAHIIHVDIEFIFSEVLDVGVLFLALLVDEGELLLGQMVKSELIAFIPRVAVIFTSSSELQSFEVGLCGRDVA